jgi:hypothetical protein
MFCIPPSVRVLLGLYYHIDNMYVTLNIVLFQIQTYLIINTEKTFTMSGMQIVFMPQFIYNVIG